MDKKSKKRVLEKGVIIVNSEGENPDLLEAIEEGGCRDISVVSQLSDATDILTSLSKDKARKLISILVYPDFDDSLLERVKEYLEEDRRHIQILLMLTEDPEELHTELGDFKNSVMPGFIHQVDLNHYQNDRNYLPNPESQERRKKADKRKTFSNA